MLASAIKCLQPLLKAVSEAELAGAALQLWQQYAALKHAWFLRLSFDGRDLEVIASYSPHKQHEASAQLFSCADFSHPFAHVAFNHKSLLLENLSSNPDLQNHQYQQWVSNNTTLLIEPVFIAQKFYGLWAVQSEQIDLNDDVQALKALVNNQLEQLVKSKRTDVERRQLASTVTTLNTNMLNSAQQQQLAQTIIGRSAPIVKLHERIVIGARSSLNVLINGETGVGKELVASAIHRFSDRAQQPFIALNCAAIPDALLESELFGYVKGAYSGATNSSTGLLGQAHKGVLFLDEIGDMPLQLQAKILRVLETKQYRQLGGQKELVSDFRLVAATHHHIPDLIKQNRFRSDLFYRLNSFPIPVPALRDRTADILPICQHLITQFNRQNNRAVAGVSTAVTSQLTALPLNGNVRELKNIIELACLHTQDNKVIEHIEYSSTDDQDDLQQGQSNDMLANAQFSLIDDLKSAVQGYERSVIIDRLQQCQGNKTMAAQTLGVPRRTFTQLCHKLELT
ncbi:sigma-54 dependent transcriptional regulator [Gammaproteobacteria bacterium AS21]